MTSDRRLDARVAQVAMIPHRAYDAREIEVAHSDPVTGVAPSERAHSLVRESRVDRRLVPMMGLVLRAMESRRPQVMRGRLNVRTEREMRNRFRTSLSSASGTRGTLLLRNRSCSH